MPILGQSIRIALGHMRARAQRRLTNSSNICLVYMFRPVAFVPEYSQSACRMRTFLRYSRLANVGKPVLGALGASVPEILRWLAC